MQRLILLILVVLYLGACATTRRYENLVESWKGKNADQLVSEWGPPSEVKTLADATRTYTYIRREKLTSGNKTGRATASAPKSGPVSCTTEFLVNADGTITGWTVTGYDCRTK